MLRLKKWRDLSLRAKGVCVVAIPATATVAIACLSFALGGRATTAEDWVNHTRQACEQIQRMETLDAEASAETRAYLMTGDDGFKLRLGEIFSSFDSAREKLVALTADRPAQQKRLAQISQMARSRPERLFGATALSGSNALPANELHAGLLAADQQRRQMETVIEAMLEEEKRVMDDRLSRAALLRAEIQMSSAICVVFGVVGGVVISILFASGITFRIEKLKENVAKLPTGGLLEPMPEGRDEIGALTQDVSQASEILRHALHGVARADSSGRYLSFNHTYAVLTGLSELSPPGSVIEAIHPLDRSRIGEAIEDMFARGRGEAEARVTKPDGSVSDASIMFLAAGYARNDGFYVFLRDISSQKEIETQLIRAKDAAIAANAAKSNFLAKISHDIRTPLNAILGAADLLSGTSLDSDQADYVDMFQRNCRRLVALINDFLDFGRIEAGALKVDKAPYKVRQSVYDAVHTFAETAARQQVDLRLEIAEDVPDWQLGDPLRLQQVLMNLVSNALKFTARGRVDVRALVTAVEGGGQLRFEVSDTGPGIRSEDQEKIFAPFTQLPNQDLAALPGSGLGLTICRELVELMGGQIGVTGAVGSGSTFYFTVPLMAAGPGVSTPAATRAPRLAPGSVSLRLLVAEDGEDNRTLLQYFLRGEPVTVQFAENGQAAVDLVLGGAEFDLILMDLDMPVLDGYAATRKIREWHASRGIRPTPIIALSAHAVEELVSASLEAGCNAHLAKPVERAVLIDTLYRYTVSAEALKLIEPAPESTSEPVAPEIAALVPQYLASKWQQLEEAQGRLLDHDLEPVRRFGHNLRGTGRGYGFPLLEKIGRELEAAAAAREEPHIAEQLDQLRQFLDQESVAVS
ncbi:MAG TPA: ATP-binding protein [Bryobacteraceae bacterium]|nr:ATP-binding protein [Bryobacteraceae bacterium]